MSLGLLNKDLRGPPSGSTRFETPETTVVRAQKVSESKVREAITYRHHLHNIKQFEASKGNKTSPCRCCVNTRPRPPVSMREELQPGGRTPSNSTRALEHSTSPYLFEGDGIVSNTCISDNHNSQHTHF